MNRSLFWLANVMMLQELVVVAAFCLASNDLRWFSETNVVSFCVPSKRPASRYYGAMQWAMEKANAHCFPMCKVLALETRVVGSTVQ